MLNVWLYVGSIFNNVNIQLSIFRSNFPPHFVSWQLLSAEFTSLVRVPPVLHLNVWWEYLQYYISMFGESINSITSPCLVRVLTVFLPRFVFWASSAVCYIEMGPGILWLDGPLRRYNVILVYRREESTGSEYIYSLHTPCKNKNSK